jgi:hypothetical protein
MDIHVQRPRQRSTMVLLQRMPSTMLYRTRPNKQQSKSTNSIRNSKTNNTKKEKQMVKFEDTITSIQIDYAKRRVFITGRCLARDMKKNGGEENGR